jgi:hypothetical protein
MVTGILAAPSSSNKDYPLSNKKKSVRFSVEKESKEQEEERLSGEMSALTGSFLSTLYAVSVVSTMKSEEAKQLDAAERSLLEAQDHFMPGTPEYAAYCTSLHEIALQRQQLIQKTESLGQIDRLIPLWELEQAANIERLKARRDALK